MTLRTAMKLFVVETCHDGTAMCVREATADETADERRTGDGWAMPLADARALAQESAAEFKQRWYDFSEEP